MTEVAPARSMRRRLLTGGSWALAGRLVTTLAPTSLLVARLLRPAAFGQWLLATSLVSFATIVGPLGGNHAAVRLVAESLGTGRPARARRALGVVLRLGLAGTAATGLLYALAGPPLARRVFDAPGLAAVTGLLVVWIVAAALQGLLADALLGFDDLRGASVFNGALATALLLGCLAVLLLRGARVGLATVAALTVAGLAASCAGAALTLRRRLAALPAQPAAADRVGAPTVLGIAVPLLLGNAILLGLSQADLWIVGAFRPGGEVAVYGVAVRMVSLVGVPQVILSAVLLSVVAELYAQGRRAELERILRGTAAVAGVPALLMLLALTVAGGPLLGTVYGGFYRAAALPLALLSLGRLVSIWSGFCGLALVMTGHQSLMLWLSVAVGVVTVAGELLAVRAGGITAVALAAAAGATLLNLAAWVAARLTTGMWTHLSLRSTVDAAVQLRASLGRLSRRRSREAFGR